MEFFTTIANAFSDGGVWMYAILVFQIVSLAIVIDRFVALFAQRRIEQEGIADSFETTIRQGEIEEVYNKAKSMEEGSPVARAIAAGSKAAMNLGGRTEIQGKMDEVLYKETSRLERRSGFLAVIGNVATLTGLLGTITGMIKAFAAVAGEEGADKAIMLSNGIAEAMTTTAYGLIVAIPALLFHALFLNRVTVLIEDLNQGAMKAFHWLSFTYSPMQTLHKRSARDKRDSSVSAEA